ncbi:nucleotidyltransferase domain-containing protein, partial [Haloquadratum walsbyi]
MSFNNRSDALIELLEELTQQDHKYVLVGGYAVSAFNARFSTDLDIVVAPDSKADFVGFLEQQGFEETDSHAKKWFYDTEVIEYEKRLTPQQPIGFDLLVNGLGCRQTEAQWSFDYLY